MSITRLTSLRKFKGVLCGRDLAGIFKPGHIYEFYEIDGTILCNDLGEGGQYTRAGCDEGHTIGQIFVAGFYMLTKAEYDAQIKKEEEERG